MVWGRFVGRARCGHVSRFFFFFLIKVMHFGGCRFDTLFNFCTIAPFYYLFINIYFLIPLICSIFAGYQPNFLFRWLKYACLISR